MNGFQLHLIEPRDPLIARDGRPFNTQPGARAATLPFPYPSTTTGGVRTRAGQDAHGVFDRTQIAAVKGIAVRGPMLVELDRRGEVSEFFAPAPLDCVFLKGDARRGPRLKRLVPAKIPDTLQVQPPDGARTITAFSEREEEDSKPETGPAFWFWEKYAQWLEDPQPRDDFGKTERAALGLKELPRDSRFHVALKESSYTHEEGKLFGTRGLEFRVPRGNEPSFGEPSFDTRRLALAVWSDVSDIQKTLRKGAGHLGGERRLMAWRHSKKSLPDTCSWAEQIAASGACRVLLLTSAFFEAGWRPGNGTGCLLESCGGVTPTLIAACVGRPQVVSGWDFERRSPKPTRRLAPSGSVYFLRLQGEPEDIEQWVNKHWLSPISDDKLSRRDGFGLAAIGTWDGVWQEDLL